MPITLTSSQVGNGLRIDNEKLRRIALFQGLADEDLTLVKCYLHRKSVTARTTLLTQRQSGIGVYLLVEGTVKICIEHNDGNTTIVALCGPGEVLGDLDSYDERGQSATVITIEFCQLLWMTKAEFHQLLSLVPSINRNLVGILSYRLRRLTENMDARHALRTFPDLIARQLLLFARDFGIRQPNGSIQIPLRLTQREIAALLGCTRESVNHVFASFRRQGYISLDQQQRITIHNILALYNRCSGYLEHSECYDFQSVEEPLSPTFSSVIKDTAVMCCSRDMRPLADQMSRNQRTDG